MAELQMKFLPKMIGKVISTYCPDHAKIDVYPPRDWVILEKLSEDPVLHTQADIDDGMGPSFTVGKYLCRLAGAGNEHKLAFMRIYKQIPLAEKLPKSEHLPAHARRPRKHVELDAMMHLTENGCTATPKLLGYQFDSQEANDFVAGGYILYLVWEKVKGDSLDSEYFWNLPYDQREVVRHNFEKAYMEVLRLGYQPRLATPSKIILDKTTGDIKICGFRRAARLRTNKEWSDNNFVMFSLALSSETQAKYITIGADDLKVVNGWKW